MAVNASGGTGSGTRPYVREAGPGEPGLLDALCRLLLDSVAGGASVGFLSSLTVEEAARFWSETLHALGERARLWVASVDDEIVGTVQVARCAKPNGRHRGDLQKLLVLRGHRGHGIATALMDAAERGAAESGLTLLVLDTIRGCDAERLYRRLGWQRAGEIPDYAGTPDGVLHPTVYYYKNLGTQPVKPTGD